MTQLYMEFEDAVDMSQCLEKLHFYTFIGDERQECINKLASVLARVKPIEELLAETIPVVSEPFYRGL